MSCSTLSIIECELANLPRQSQYGPIAFAHNFQIALLDSPSDYFGQFRSGLSNQIGKLIAPEARYRIRFPDIGPNIPSC
jgi:hypothetical protein